MRIVWLTPYPVGLLHPEVTFLRNQLSHAASWVVTLSQEFSSRAGIELHIATACAGVREDHHVRKEGITFHLIKHTFPFTVRGFPQYLRLDAMTHYANLRMRLSKVLKDVSPDVIHVHGTEYGYGLAAIESRLPAVISMQGIISRIRAVENNTFYWLQAPIERKVVRSAKYFGSRTDWASEFIKQLNPTATIYRMDEAVSPAFFEYRARTESKNILFVGGLMKRKGIEVAIEAMASVVRSVPTATLSVVGSGNESYLQSLQRKAAALGIGSNVLWLGSKTSEEIAALHARSNLLVHPSFIDNSPNTVAEAMVTGLPVVVTRVGGIVSMIADDETGLLVEPGKPKQLADVIVRVLGDGTLRERLARNAKDVARLRHRSDSVAEQAMGVYNDILTKEQMA